MPSTTLPGCYGARNLVAVRASRLDADGTRICPNTDGSAYTVGGQISLDMRRSTDGGQTDVIRDGDGGVCNVDTTPEIVTGITGTLTLCVYDFQFIELVTGARLLVDAGVGYGFEEADPNDTPPLIEFHWWSRAWVGASQAVTPYQYLHGVAVATRWRLGDEAFNNTGLTIPLLFTGRANENIVIGTFDDIPLDVQGDGFTAQWFADDVPDPTAAPYSDNGLTCGYVDSPACSAS
jgi:hypothetical protein